METQLDRLDEQAADVARQQGGVLTRAQALELGATRAQVQTALRTGRWTTVGHGAHAPRRELPGEGTPGRTALAVAAAVLRVDGGLVAAGRTAALVHGLPVLGRPSPKVELVRPHRPGQPRRNDVPTVWLPGEQVERVHGVVVTDLRRTVVDVARRSPLVAGVITADAALRRGLSPELVGELLELCRGWPGAVQAARVLDLARPGAESALESLGRVRMVEQGVPEPELQVDVRDAVGLIGRVDHLWRRERVVGEADGLGKYTDRADLVAEKLREDRLREAGLEVVRYTWDEALHQPQRLAARFWAAVERARRRR